MAGTQTFHILTFGCKVNQYETEALREAWLAAGALETDDPASADVLCVNTCAVTSQAVADARRAVRRLRREAPAARLVLTGCAAAKVVEEAENGPLAGTGVAGTTCVAGTTGVAGTSGAAVWIVEPARKHELLALFAAGNTPSPQTAPSSAGIDPLKAESSAVFPPFSISGFRRSRPVLKVQDGCTQGCAYCIVPLARGPSRSRDPQDALAELRRLLQAGFREIMISGINLRQYSAKKHGCANFWELLAFLDNALAPEWAGRARLRLSSVDPAQLDAQGLETLAATRLVCPHIHLSLQSGSAAVLRRMGRPHYSPQSVLDAVAHVARIWPVFALGADVLTGFPGETEAEAEENLAVVRALPLTYAHVFPYSERPGTRAASLPQSVAPEDRRNRAARVRGVVSAKRRAFLESCVGTTCLVALEPEGHGVNELYVSCRPRQNAQTVPAGASGELFPARVTAVEKGGLVVTGLTR